MTDAMIEEIEEAIEIEMIGGIETIEETETEEETEEDDDTEIAVIETTGTIATETTV